MALALLIALCCVAAVITQAAGEEAQVFSERHISTLRQPGCRVYIFNFEKEIPNVGQQLAPNATTRICTYDGVAAVGGPFFLLKAITNKTSASAWSHVARGVQPHMYGQHAGPWWLANHLAASQHVVDRMEEADVIYVDDSCYVIWYEAMMHSGGSTAALELYVNPAAYLKAAYDALLEHPVFMGNRSKFVFYHSHPAFQPSALTKNPLYTNSIRIVTEGCMSPSTPVHRRLIVPYAALKKYQHFPKERSSLMYFRASCGGTAAGKQLRKMIGSLFSGRADSLVQCQSVGWEEDIHHGMILAKFCPITQGDTAASRRLTEAVLYGCVPVLIGPPFPTMPLHTIVNYAHFSVILEVQNRPWLGGVSPHVWQCPPHQVLPTHKITHLQELPDLLQNISLMQYAALQHHLQKVQPLFSFQGTDLSGGRLLTANLADVMYSSMCHHAAQVVDGQ